MRQRFRKLMGVGLAILALAAVQWSPVRHLSAWPRQLWVPYGDQMTIPWSLRLPVSVRDDGTPGLVQINGRRLGRQWLSLRSRELTIRAQHSGTSHLSWRLFGWLPWRGTQIKVSAPLYVVAGGESVGVMVHTRGLIVTGLVPIANPGQRTQDPAQSAGIERGDLILSANGHPLATDSSLQRTVQTAGRIHQPVALSVQGARRVHIRHVLPVWSLKSHQYQLGLLIQSGATGVGTLTYYNPVNQTYGALGHSLTDGLTRAPAPILSGRILSANIVGIVPGSANRPGQKVGVLARHGAIQGNVRNNTTVGISGLLNHVPEALTGARPIPVAMPDQVVAGPAHIITVLHGQKPESYRIEILRSYRQWSPSPKGLLFKVVDPRLTRQTGGIIQGMSGSPIIQHGRLVGAVTHVLIGQPTVGYGCFATWMVQESNHDATVQQPA